MKSLLSTNKQKITLNFLTDGQLWSTSTGQVKTQLYFKSYKPCVTQSSTFHYHKLCRNIILLTPTENSNIPDVMKYINFILDILIVRLYCYFSYYYPINIANITKTTVWYMDLLFDIFVTKYINFILDISIVWLYCYFSYYYAINIANTTITTVWYVDLLFYTFGIVML